jgi:predicted amidophosphoribosyltransferase
MWKGEKVGMTALHEWIGNRLPKPKVCECCKKDLPRDLANKGTYDRDFMNWEWLCRRCHMTKDGRLKNLTPGIAGKNWHPPKPRFGKDNPLWKGGKPNCKDCGKKLSSYAFKQCQKCYQEDAKERLIAMSHYAIGKRNGYI